MPLVSVIIPTFNRQYCVGRAVDSVLDQTHRNVEVIVVDDGSTDGTLDYLEQRYRNEARVRAVHQANAGAAAARNHGFRLVQGEYVALLDSDDVWKPWKLELQLACMRQFPELGMTWTDMAAVDPHGTTVDGRYLQTMFHNYRRFPPDRLFQASHALATLAPRLADTVGSARLFVGDIYGPIVLGSLVATSAALLRRDRLEGVGGFDETLRVSGEDHDFHLRVCREGPVGLIDVPAIECHVGRGDQLTHRSHSVHVARNYLRTMTTALERDGARIGLPSRLVNTALAGAHAWLGEALLEAQQSQPARTHLSRSLRLRPGQGRTLALYAMSWLPPRTQGSLRAAYRKLRGRTQPAAAG
jgi:GT2 family glycosyltransferase